MDRLSRFGSVMALLWAIGCGSEGSDPVAPPIGGPKTITAIVDGVGFVSDTILGGFWGDSLEVTAWTSEGRRITLHSTEVTGPGTYVMPVESTSTSDTYAVFGNGEDFFPTGNGYGSGGILTITTVTATRLTGTFSFVGHLYSWDPAPPDSVRVEQGFIDINMP